MVAKPTEIQLIRNTLFEQLMQEGSKEQDRIVTAATHKKNLADIYRSVISVYFFLRQVTKIPYRPMTLEEYEVGRARLREMAETEVKKLLYRFRFNQGWAYYLENGYFGTWKQKVPPIFSKFRRIFYHDPYNTVPGDWYQSNEVTYYYKGSEAGRFKEAVPDNLSEIARVLFEVKYGCWPF